MLVRHDEFREERRILAAYSAMDLRNPALFPIAFFVLEIATITAVILEPPMANRA